MAHTPGPWQVVPPERAIHPWIVGDHECGSVADCEPPGPWMSFEEAAANARLCAAAPDLLAACKEARFRLFGTGPSAQPLSYQLDAAIARAEAAQ